MKDILLLLLLAAQPALFVEAGEFKAPPVQLTVDLTDGSRVIGTTTLTSLPMRSEALGKIEVPLAKVRAIKFSRDQESVAVTLINGDSVKGGLGDLSLRLRTVFGDITVPVDRVTTIKVSLPATDRDRFSAAQEFSAESNPQGTWSYGRSATPGAKFQLYTTTAVDDVAPEIRVWGVKVFGPCVAANTGAEARSVASDSVIFKSGQLAFHPGPSGECSVIRWTTPRAGRFAITGGFIGLSGNNGASPTTTDVHVFQNDKPLIDSFLNLRNCGNEVPFKLERQLEAGDTIDFIVGFGNGSHSCDTTGLEAVITLKGNQP
jgi:hypothetical protein